MDPLNTISRRTRYRRLQTVLGIATRPIGHLRRKEWLRLHDIGPTVNGMRRRILWVRTELRTVAAGSVASCQLDLFLVVLVSIILVMLLNGRHAKEL